MLFSNFVTDLSANSARVSACNDSICFGQHWDVLDFHRENERMEIKTGSELLVSLYREGWRLAQQGTLGPPLNIPDMDHRNCEMKKP